MASKRVSLSRHRSAAAVSPQRFASAAVVTAAPAGSGEKRGRLPATASSSPHSNTSLTNIADDETDEDDPGELILTADTDAEGSAEAVGDDATGLMMVADGPNGSFSGWYCSPEAGLASTWWLDWGRVWILSNSRLQAAIVVSADPSLAITGRTTTICSDIRV